MLVECVERLQERISQVKYGGQLSTNRKEIDEAARMKADMEVKLARLQDDFNEYRRL